MLQASLSSMLNFLVFLLIYFGSRYIIFAFWHENCHIIPKFDAFSTVFSCFHVDTISTDLNLTTSKLTRSYTWMIFQSILLCGETDPCTLYHVLCLLDWKEEGLIITNNPWNIICPHDASLIHAIFLILLKAVWISFTIKKNIMLPFYISFTS